MAAIGAVWGMCDTETIRNLARTFGGVEHRCELVCTKDGVRYFNSSIDSSPSRTIATLGCFPSTQPVVLVLGGYDKQIPFDDLAEPVCAQARCVILTGATAEKIGAVLRAAGYPEENLHHIPDFDQAIQSASAHAIPGDVVLFSPACASFDAFPNFEARGRRFKEIVSEKAE